MKTSMILNYSDLSEMSETDPGYRSFRSGQDYFRRGDYNEAIKRFQHAQKSVPNFAVAWDFLGFAYLALGHHKQAAQSFFWAEECREKGAAKNLR
jgi:Flp pilus assembly protein TadD